MADTPIINLYEPDANGIEQIVSRPMTDAEYAQWKTDRADAVAAQLAADRAAKSAGIQAALAATDQWVTRAWEDGLTALPTVRAAYRDQLRELLLQVAASDDPAAIEIPAAPAWVPPKS